MNLRQLLHTGDTPQRTAAAFALGVLLGFSPLIGLHTILGLALAFAFNVNRIAVLLGVYVNLPWIMPAYYTAATLAGAWLLGVDIPPEFVQQLRDGTWTAFRSFAHVLRPLAGAFVLGSTAGAVVLALCAYRLSLAAIVARGRMAAAHPQGSEAV